MLEGGVAGLPGQPVLWLVEITSSPAPGLALSPIKGQTARDKAAKLRVAIILVLVKNPYLSLKHFKNVLK